MASVPEPVERSTVDDYSRRFEPTNGSMLSQEGYSNMLSSISDLDVSSDVLASASLFHSSQYQQPYSNFFSPLTHLGTSHFEQYLVPSSGTAFEPDSTGCTSSVAHSPPTDITSTLTASFKLRRRRPKVDLAPNQPLTTLGKPRTRVFSACLQCRSRKIRCNGGKPACHRCSRRPSDGPCTYNVMPNRRGPDRELGARQRVKDGSRNPRRRRRSATDATKLSLTTDNGCMNPPAIPPPATAASSASDVFPPEQTCGLKLPPVTNEASYIPDFPSLPNCMDMANPLMGLSQVFNAPLCSQFLPLSQKLELFDYRICSAPSAYTEFHQNEDSQNQNTIVEGPSLGFVRQTWWDALLSSYFLPGGSCHLQTLNSAEREMACQQVTKDVRFLFRSTHFWFCFFNVPRFLATFSDPRERVRMQPSSVLAILAISTFLQSSEIGMGMKGRKKAMRLRDEAQGALEASLNAGWIDEQLVQAAWLIAFFEICAHPYHSSQRVISSVIILDSLIRCMQLTTLDADDPRITIFSPEAPPVVPTHQPLAIEKNPSVNNIPASFGYECECARHSLGSTWRIAQNVTPSWVSTPAWTEGLSESDTRKEECRRLVWSSMMLVAGHSSYSAVHLPDLSWDLFLFDASNYAILFPGESLASSDAQAKGSIWSLHVRAMMLWNSCLKMRRDSSVSDSKKAQFAITAWLESYALDDALNRHACDIERSYMFLGREYLFNTRMCISYEFRQFVPCATVNMNAMFDRKKAEEWLTHQAVVMKQLEYGLHRVTGQAGGSVVHRPFFMFWFMGQISRTLTLWSHDNKLTVALDASKAMMAAVEHLMSLWPCDAQRVLYDELRERLENACVIAGVSPPSQRNLSLGCFAS